MKCNLFTKYKLVIDQYLNAYNYTPNSDYAISTNINQIIHYFKYKKGTGRFE